MKFFGNQTNGLVRYWVMDGRTFPRKSSNLYGP